MNMQELIKKSALIEKTLKEQGLQERARSFISENAVIKTEELEKTLKEMQDTDRNLKVGIIGRVKAGKSSLLNALIFEGVEVLPKAATPMTASLTVLKYAQNLSAEVEFYSQKDIAELENEHERYVREFNRIVDEEVKRQKEKQSPSNRIKEGFKNLGNKFSRNKSDKEAPKGRILSDEEILEKARRIAKSELEKDTKLVSSHDQYEKMKKSGLTNTETKDSRIQANSLEELNQKLLQFVGANGKFMPCTKAVQISLNNPNLKDLEVIDTPGINDPIVSREERTKALLKDCHVVFIVSPSSQFLTDSDMDLFDRVSNKEGLQEIYFVASQTDSVVCAPSEAQNSRHHLPTALENAQKSLSSSLNATMSLLKKKYPHQQEIFEKAIKNGVILTSGACFSMYKDFKNQASWERNQKTEEYHNALRNLRDSYPDAFNSADKSKESLLLLSNMGAIKERLEKAAQRKEEIISQRLQDYAQSQASNLHNLIAQLLKDLEDEKKRVKNADMGAIKKQIEAYEKLSGNIEIGFREAYEEFIFHFIKNTRDGLNETLTKAIQKAKVGARKEEKEVIERYTERVKQGGLGGSFKRNFLWFFDDDAGYDEVERTRDVMTIKAGAVVDYLIEMHKICEKALNDSVGSFKIDFRKDLYAKVFPVLRQIIRDDDLIDEVAFKKSVHAVTDKIKFEEFHYTLPSEIGAQTGFLKGDGAVQFIQSVETHLRGFEAETTNDVKKYCTDLEKELEKQDFANGVLSKLKKDMQNLHNQAQNKEQSIAQLDAQIQALKEIQ
ncbi:dynamin-like GTPase family protein [Helicobacter pylori]|nr:dynamin-like GTPase family protein [Helicobacter pylori]